MSSESLRDLYQEVILDHNRSPRNFGPLPGADHHAEGHNPLCGDHIVIHLAVAGETIKDVRFEGSGCAISKASASLMTSALKGKTVTEVKTLFEKFRQLVTTPMDRDPGDLAPLGKLAVFAGVREFPMRVKCASLAWHTLLAALAGGQAPVTTE